MNKQYGTRKSREMEKWLWISKGNWLMWEFEYKMRQSSAARRPAQTLQDKENTKILLCDMAGPQEKNIEVKM